MKSSIYLAGIILTVLCPGSRLYAGNESALRLVPFPKEIRLERGRFALDRQLVLEIFGSAMAGELLTEELIRNGLPRPQIQKVTQTGHILRLSTKAGGTINLESSLRKEAGPEDYILEIGEDSVTVIGHGPAGLDHRGLLRAVHGLRRRRPDLQICLRRLHDHSARLRAGLLHDLLPVHPHDPRVHEVLHVGRDPLVRRSQPEGKQDRGAGQACPGLPSHLERTTHLRRGSILGRGGHLPR